MLEDEAIPRAEAAFRRRFRGLEADRIRTPQPGYLRLRDTTTSAWVDYDISGDRIRVLRWNAPAPKTV